MSIAIVLGLTAAVCWGSADFLVRALARSLGSYRTLLFVQFPGFVLLGTYLAFSGELAQQLRSVNHGVWIWALLAALLDLVATLGLYRALEIGIVSVVSPIVASYAAITTILSILSGEILSGRQAVGTVLALIGVVLTAGLLVRGTMDHSEETAAHRDAARGVFWAVVSASTYGVTFWVLGFHVTSALGGTTPVWIVRLVVITMVLTLAAPLRRNVALPQVGNWGVILLIGILDTGGLVAVAKSAHGDQTAIVGVLSSLFSAVTLLLAWIFLRERLAASQWLGVSAVFVGVALLSA